MLMGAVQNMSMSLNDGAAYHCTQRTSLVEQVEAQDSSEFGQITRIILNEVTQSADNLLFSILAPVHHHKTPFCPAHTCLILVYGNPTDGDVAAFTSPSGFL
jgi:hypothetical protein